MASDHHGGTPLMISDAVANWCDDVFRIYAEMLDAQRRLTVALIRSAAPVLDVGERAGEKAAAGAERLSATVQARRGTAPGRAVDGGAGEPGDEVPRITDAAPAGGESGVEAGCPGGGAVGGGAVEDAAITDAAVWDTAVEDIDLGDVGLEDPGVEDAGVGVAGEDIGVGVEGAVDPVGGEVDAGDEEIAEVLDGEELEVFDDRDEDTDDAPVTDDRPAELVDVADVEAELGETDAPVPAGGAEGGEEGAVIGDLEAVTEASGEADTDTAAETASRAEPALDARPARSKGSNGSRRRSPGAKRKSGSSA